MLENLPLRFFKCRKCGALCSERNDWQTICIGCFNIHIRRETTSDLSFGENSEWGTMGDWFRGFLLEPEFEGATYNVV